MPKSDPVRLDYEPPGKAAKVVTTPKGENLRRKSEPNSNHPRLTERRTGNEKGSDKVGTAR
ncbi:hypothetical protein, partial [Streptomyces sp. NRRL F-4489]|uniref:hypothetical protein n=1 Tax=Streptomyces sp. NRRL F-4489 TaxID=1609095 RepID=UPI001F20E34D